MISKNKKRITITLSNDDIKRLNETHKKCPEFKTKSKLIAHAIYHLWRAYLDFYD